MSFREKSRNLIMKKILVTGSAGFIGANLVLRLLKEGFQGEPVSIVGLDNLNDYYDPSLKEYRLSVILSASSVTPSKVDGTHSQYRFVKGDLADKALVDRLFAEEKFDIVVNLAAQAGVRYSIENPDAYIQSNVIGFYNILEACRHSLCHSERSEESRSFGKPQDDSYKGVRHLVYASSSSVYGGNKKIPFSVEDRVDYPVSLYAATKKSNELFAHCYSKLYGIPTTGLRFFTVYGPAGRPDMAYFGFTDKLLAGKTIQIFNYGNCRRDFTYVDDIVEGLVRVMAKAPACHSERSEESGSFGLRPQDDNAGSPQDDNAVPYAIYNIGGGQPENLLDFVNILQAAVNGLGANVVAAVTAAASVLGAPLMHDFAVISLSDQLTPWDVIARRLRCAAAGDFVIALYNPKSKTRQAHLGKAQAIIMEERAAHTPVGIVTNAGRPGEEKLIITLEELRSATVNMSSLVIVGNSKTYVQDGYMITPRGYEEKYEL